MEKQYNLKLSLEELNRLEAFLYAYNHPDRFGAKIEIEEIRQKIEDKLTILKGGAK